MKLANEIEKSNKQEKVISYFNCLLLELTLHKMYEEALESMRKDYANLEQENRSLKNKLVSAGMFLSCLFLLSPLIRYLF